MSRPWAQTAATTLLVAIFPAVAAGQRSGELIDRGIRAYQVLDYDNATLLLRRALAAPPSDTVPVAERVRALNYLAASELYRGRRDSAAAVFRRLVLSAPRAHPDLLIFPPEVTTVFEATRRSTKAVLAELPADTTLQAGEGRYPIVLFASSFHEIVVALEQEDGRFLRGLYAGAIGDSLLVSWDGLDSAGVPMRTGRYALSVTSRPSPGGEILRVLQLRLDVRATSGRDTLPWPAKPDSLPERTTPGPALRALALGMLSGAAALALPPVVARGSRPSGARFGVAGAVSLAGILGYFARKPGQPLPQSIAVNSERRAAWQGKVGDVQHENTVRRRTVQLTLRSGKPVVIEREAP